MPHLNEFEAALLIRMSPELLAWFTSYAPKHGKNRKLPCKKSGSVRTYDSDELTDFDMYLRAPWPIPSETDRPGIPAGVEREIRVEADNQCANCGDADCDFAHIDPVWSTKSNHPANLIFLCVRCHRRYDRTKQLTRKDIQGIKDRVVNVRMTVWGAQAMVIRDALALVKRLRDLVESAEASPDLAPHQVARLEAALLEAVAAHTAALATEDTREALRARGVRSVMASAPKGQAARTTTKALLAFRAHTLSNDNEVDCPVCDGGGIFRGVRCPACNGVGTMDAEAARHVNKADFASECPLCKGSGEHNRSDCPVCWGEGYVAPHVAEEIDLSLFAQRECPLCRGAGEHNRLDCPVCVGVGTIDARHEFHVDLSRYRQRDCPLCKGSGEHNRRDCPLCLGVGTINDSAVAHVDLSPFKQHDCPLCKGTGERNGGDCPICLGEGTIDERDLDYIDLSQFKETKCPACQGSGVYNSFTCNYCQGSGRAAEAVLDDVDLSDFEMVDCPGCDGSGVRDGYDCQGCRGSGQLHRRHAREMEDW